MPSLASEAIGDDFTRYLTGPTHSKVIKGSIFEMISSPEISMETDPSSNGLKRHLSTTNDDECIERHEEGYARAFLANNSKKNSKKRTVQASVDKRTSTRAEERTDLVAGCQRNKKAALNKESEKTLSKDQNADLLLSVTRQEPSSSTTTKYDAFSRPPFLIHLRLPAPSGRYRKISLLSVSKRLHSAGIKFQEIRRYSRNTWKVIFTN